MRLPFAGRLLLQSLLTIGALLTILILGIVSILFLSYVQNLNVRNATLRSRVPNAFALYHVPAGDPDAAARAIVEHTSSIGLRILTFNSATLVIAAAANPSSQANGKIAFERGPFGRIPVPAPDLAQQLVFGLATAFGLRPVHFLYRGVGIEINADPAVLVRVVRSFALALAGWLVIGGACVYAAATLLNRQALRPLDEVVVALEAFGGGDLTPRSVDAVAKDEFGRLAVAYNGAVRAVTAAFAQRDLAEAETRRFIADAAHQLRTPLTVVQGFIGILLKNDPLPADRERILWSMDRQIRAMGSLIEKLTLLDHWEATQTNPQLTDIGDCVAEIIQPLAASRPTENVAFAQDPACYALVDSGEIREAVGNVLDNALKYGAGAPVSVRVAAVNGEVRIVVADRGPGMSTDEQRNAFRRFYRGEHRKIAGSGLGLAIAKRAVERAGGAIAIASGPETGTAVTISLPRQTLEESARILT